MDGSFSNLFLQSKPWEPDNSESPIDFENVAESLLPKIDIEVQLQNIMDCILPPKTKVVNGEKWKSRTSTVPATRLEMVSLEEKFDEELKERSAKEFGICPIRRELFDQLFDELIRQVTVECAERGLLLLRVRDELRATILAYQSLLESSISYGVRKAIVVETEQSRAVIERDQERAKNKELTAKINQLEKQIVNEKLINEDELHTLEQRMREDNERLLESNKVLRNQLQAILQMERVGGPSSIDAEGQAITST